MNASSWLSRGADKVRFNVMPPEAASAMLPLRTALVEQAQATAPKAAGAGRSTSQRLQATLRRDAEALSPRALRRMLADLQAIIDPHVSEVEGGRRARALADWYATASPEERRDVWAG